MNGQQHRRPGGRSARVKSAVHQAITKLIAERGYGNFAVKDVAVRAGVADTSIYRRWGNLETLLAEVAAERLTAASPVPDTGSLVSDLRTYAAGAARDISGPDGMAVLQLVIALARSGTEGLNARAAFLDDRSAQLQRMLDRAAARGENTPELLEVIDHLLAPIYLRTLFGDGPVTDAYTDALVDRLLDHR